MLTIAGLTHAQMKPGDVRRAYGDARASVIESVLTTVYPEAQVQWDPQLAIQFPNQPPRMVQVPVYVRGSAVGGLEGVATIDFERRKEQYIYEAENFRRNDRPSLPTELIVFRADTAGHIQNYKRVMLDEGEPVTELKTMSIQDWRQEWPLLEIQYDTHRASMNAFTTIEWRASFDANREQFISRVPMGISRRVRGGGDQMIALGLKRTSPGTVLLTSWKGESHDYFCADPCVMDADTLLSEFKLNDPPAAGQESDQSNGRSAQTGLGSSIIRLKNGRVIHADSSTEVGDHVEYTIGESEYRIPKSLVQDTAHSNAAMGGSETSHPSPQSTSTPQGGDTSCLSSPHVGCPAAFFIQVLMGLGETQRFALLDHNGRNITAEARWTIDSDSDVDFSVVDGVPRLYSKSYGMLHLFATADGHIAIARVYIVKPDELNSNTMGRIGNPQFNDATRPLQILAAAPYGGRLQ